MYGLMTGAIVMAHMGIALFFLKFWKKSHDRLFLLFSLAFLFMAINRIGLAFIDEGVEFYYTGLYVLRLIAFLLILFAIIDKNRAGRSSH